LIAGSLAFGTTAVVVTGEGAWRAPCEATRSNVLCPTQSRNCRNQLRQSAFSSHDRSALSACDRVSLWSETPVSYCIRKAQPARVFCRRVTRRSAGVLEG